MIQAIATQQFEASLINAPSGLTGTIGVQIIDPTSSTVITPRTTGDIVEFPSGSGVYTAQLIAPDPGDYLILWDQGTVTPTTTAEEQLNVIGLPSGPATVYPQSGHDIRVLIPRVRRAVEGVGTPVLTDNQIRDITADAIADIILLSGGAFGHELVVTAIDHGIPVEYATTETLTLAEGSVIAAQAALSHLTRTLATMKVSETIRDEGQEWSYATSAQAITERIKQLIADRDAALAMLAAKNFVPVSFVNLLHERDRSAGLLEPPLGIGYR